LERLGITKVLEYERFKDLDKSIQDYFLQKDQFKTYQKFDEIEADHIQVLSYDSRDSAPTVAPVTTVDDFNYDFGSLCRQSVKQAFSDIFSKTDDPGSEEPLRSHYREEEIKTFKKVECTDLHQTSCEHVLEKLKSSACVLVDISENRNSNYFWLGYVHGMGANAIPISVIRRREKPAEATGEVPFDVRALWSVAFPEDNPEMLVSSLKDILESIYLEKAKNRNRRRFWNQILTDGAVSVFLGSRYLKDLERNALGDWDYRTAAEITSFLSSQKETIKVTLESPIAWRPKLKEDQKAEYAKWLRAQLKDKNCIIVASADVNDLTEVALCDIYNNRKLFGTSGGEDRTQEPFTAIPKEEYRFRGYIAYKEYKANAEKGDKAPSPPDEDLEKENAFYTRRSGDWNERGFRVQRGTWQQNFVQPHASLTPDDKGLKNLLGQLVVAENPECTPGHPKKWIIIISGISGPATLGIAQILTGCVYKEFTTDGIPPGNAECSSETRKECANDTPVKCPNDRDDRRECIYRAVAEFRKDCPPDIDGIFKSERTVPYGALSEELLKKLIKSSSNGGECNAIITVGVFYPGTISTQIAGYSNDERKIVAWTFSNLTGKVGSEWKNPSALDLSAPSRGSG
jgi:hypothetical protein